MGILEGLIMDMILRLSKSTTEDLSVFIGFGSECKVKFMVVDKNMLLYVRLRFFSNLYFDPGVIWARFRHRNSIFRDRYIEIL